MFQRFLMNKKIRWHKAIKLSITGGLWTDKFEMVKFAKTLL